jgi:hypothetical protein
MGHPAAKENAMRSSAEEFLLVRKKWKTDNATVRLSAVVVIGEFRSVCILDGAVLIEESSSSVGVLADNGSMFVVDYSSSIFGFTVIGESDREALDIMQLDNRKILESLMIAYEDGCRVVLCLLENE